MATPRQIAEEMPVGYRFKPTDEELINHFLKNKIRGKHSLVRTISEIELYKHEPWDLPDFSEVKSDDRECFFFTRRENMSSNSTRSKRATEAGYWKATGKDREIKRRGTIIGTKKTLVFYLGRVPNGFKTDWVIHEYHAVTLPVHERTFVLCRLMDKTQKEEEERDNVLGFDEGEPSSHMVSDYENHQSSMDTIPDVDSLPEVDLESIFKEMPPAGEFDLPPIQQSAILFEQEISVQNSPLPSINFGNETTEEEEDVDRFLNSILLAEDVCFSGEMQHAFVNESTPSESWRRVHYESSDTDAEVVSRFGNVLGTSTAYNQHDGSRECRVMKMVKTSHSAANSRTHLTSRLEASRNNEGSIFFGDSSVGFTSDEPSINCLQIASSPSPPRRHSPESVNVAQKVASRRPLQRKASRKEKPKNEDRKEASTVESRKDQRKAQGTSSGKNLEAARNHSSGVNRIGSFIHLETSLLSQKPMPRSMYLLNVVVGLFLLIVTIWDLISFAK